MMPPDRPLEKIEIDLIKVWIETGATGITGTKNNIPPTVNAGVDRVITLPQNSISLTGTATDSDGSLIKIVWAQLSGPNNATFTNKFTRQPNISGLIAGIYIFELLVEDNNNAIATDNVQLTVLPPVAPPTPPPTPTPITFTQVNTTIIQTRCISCHSGASPTGNFSMANYSLVMSRIVAGNASNSIFYQKVLNNSMPKNGTPLNASEKKLIFDWIQAGALNN